MKIYFGTELYGRFHQPDQSFIGTKFFHILYLPLIPLGTYHVRGETTEGATGQKIGLKFGSVLSGYFKVWGFIASLGLLAWGSYMLDRRSIPWEQFLGVPLAGISLLAAVIGSWLWIGTKPRRTGRIKVPLLSLGIPILVTLMVFGYGWWDRYDFDQRAQASNAGESETTTEKRVDGKKQGEFLGRSDDYVQRLYRLTTAVYNKKEWSGQTCDDSRIKAGIKGERGKHLAVSEYNYLAFLASPGQERDEARKNRAWLVSDSVKDFPYNYENGGNEQLDDLDKRPFFGVIRIFDAPVEGEHETKGGAAKRTLTGRLAIFEVATGEMLCDTTFTVDSTLGNGQEPPPKEIQTAFKAAAQAKLGEISTVLRIYADDRGVAEAKVAQ